jgi:hypothetical protein
MSSLADIGTLTANLSGGPIQSATNPVVTTNVTTGSVFGATSTSLPTPGSIFGQAGTGFSGGNIATYGVIALLFFAMWRLK